MEVPGRCWKFVLIAVVTVILVGCGGSENAAETPPPAPGTLPDGSVPPTPTVPPNIR